MVDRPQFLDEIWKISEGTYGSMDEFLINENPMARSMFKTLVDVYLNPEKALHELEMIEQERVAIDIGSTVLQEELLELMTDPRAVKRGKQATTQHLMTWWRSFASSVKRLHLPDHQLHPYHADLEPQLPFEQ
jgi:hypothetical protein